MSQVNAYQQVSVHTSVEDATPHQLIQMLFDGAIEAMSQAKTFMTYEMTAEKGKFISKSISIIGGLQDSLNREKGGEIAANLDKLYNYLTTELTLANAHNDTLKLDKLIAIVDDLAAGWRDIANAVNPA